LGEGRLKDVSKLLRGTWPGAAGSGDFPMLLYGAWGEGKERWRVVSRPGVAAFLLVKDRISSAAFNLKAAFKVF